MNQRVLVTGGAGYIGSHAVKLLCDQGREVLVIDDLSEGHLAAVHPSAAFIQGDLSSSSDYQRLLDAVRAFSPTFVIHFAAPTSVPESRANPLKYSRGIVTASTNLLQILQDVSVRNIIVSSTAASYASKDELITEDDRQDPTNPYGFWKWAVQHLLQHQLDAGHLDRAVACHYFNVCGVDPAGILGEDHREEGHVCPNIVRAMRGLLPSFSMFAGGNYVRDYIHVWDLVRAHVDAMNLEPSALLQRFNISTGAGHSVRELVVAAHELCDELGVEQFTVLEREGRTDEPKHLVADPRKCKDVLGWSPEHVDIKGTLLGVYQWMVSRSNSVDANGYGYGNLPQEKGAAYLVGDA